MNLFASAAILFSLFCVRGQSFVEIDIPPETVSDFDPSAYSGRWYQVYSSLIPTLSYEKGGFCVIADYSHMAVTEDSASFDVLNSENKGSPTGELKQAKGQAINDHFQYSPGEFRLTFDNVKAPFAGFYWIVRLGEMGHGETQYPWAIVSVPFQTTVFILARDVGDFRLKYEADVLALVRELGYKYFFNKPIETMHSNECKYPPEPKAPPKPSVEILAEPDADTFVESFDVEDAELEDRRSLQRDPSPDRTRKPKSPSIKKSKQPKPPSLRRSKQPKPPSVKKTKSPTASPSPAKPKPPPTPAKPEPPPTLVKPKPPPHPEKPSPSPALAKPEPPPKPEPQPPKKEAEAAAPPWTASPLPRKLAEAAAPPWTASPLPKKETEAASPSCG